MKKLINSPENVVREALEGIALAHVDRVRVSLDPFYIARKDAPVKGKVAVVSGGGSGHEPMQGGYVGFGGLDAACPGHVFTSPTPDQMFEASKAVHGGAGVLHLFANYTGDIMNFDVSEELLREEKIEVARVLSDDDVAVQNSLYTTGRRGVALTILLDKLVGAAAEAGMNLAQVKAFGDSIRATGRTMGMALTSCTIPHVGKPIFELGDNEMEVGIGVHGEPGRQRLPIVSADEITEMLLEPVIADLPYKSGDNVILFVNGMGATPLIELYIIYRKAAEIAAKHGLKVVRNLVGNYFTSLDMAGVSVTLLRADDNVVKMWDAPINTAALRWGI
jgi:dihydroxyacetone kinase-like protein